MKLAGATVAETIGCPRSPEQWQQQQQQEEQQQQQQQEEEEEEEEEQEEWRVAGI